MIDCLVGYIGSLSVSGTAESGLYLDALPGIKLINFDKVHDESQTNVDFFSNIEKRAILKFRTLFISELNQCIKLYVREAVDCLICENKELLSESLWYLIGAEFIQDSFSSNRINRYTTVDRAKLKEQQDLFMEEFYRTLHVAVLGIDIENSTCFETDDKPECMNITTFFEATP
jgi:hypothetical protein